MASLFGEKLVNDLKISHSFEKCTDLNLQRISISSTKSKHCFICVPGFLQQNDDRSTLWANVVQYYKHAEIFALTWTSCAPSMIFDDEYSGQKRASAFKKVLNFAAL